MTIGYILIGLLVLILALFFLARANRPRHSAALPDDSSIIQAQAAMKKSRAQKRRPRSESLDAEMTQIHRGPVRTASPAAREERKGAAQSDTAARLVGLSGSQKDIELSIPPTGLSIGRSPACEVVIVDHRVSSRHAWIGAVNGKFVLRDLNSTNGTFINARTEAAVGEVELCHGDTIFFGSHQGDQFRFLAK